MKTYDGDRLEEINSTSMRKTSKGLAKRNSFFELKIVILVAENERVVVGCLLGIVRRTIETGITLKPVYLELSQL